LTEVSSLDSVTSTLGFDAGILLGILIVLPFALCIGFLIRKATNLGRFTDFITLSLFGCVLALYLVFDISFVWCGLFILFYIIGNTLGSYVTDREKKVMLKLGLDEDGNFEIDDVEGLYFIHKKHGLCRLPETNIELFNQACRGIYHKVKSVNNVPMNANVIDKRSGRKAILIEDIETRSTRDKSRFLHPKVPVTTIRVAHGSQIPSAKLLTDAKTLDTMNKIVEVTLAKTTEMETKIMAKLPQISADQLIAIAENNTVMEIVNQYMDNEEKRKGGDDGRRR